MRHISEFSRVAATIAAIVCGLVFSAQALAAGVDDLSSKETSSGLKEALSRGAEMAVSQLGKPNGFMGDARVKIPLPESLQGAEKMMRKLGMKKQADKLIETMNRAAESAVVEAKPILVNAVKNMSFDDAKTILTGGDDAATQYFKRTTSAPIGEKFLPIVKQATAKVQLAEKYNQYAGKAASLGLIDDKDADLDSYVTQKALDGLFLMIAEQEKAIRKDPIGTGSSLLQTVFGALLK
jgi:hypothetical protein